MACVRDGGKIPVKAVCCGAGAPVYRSKRSGTTALRRKRVGSQAADLQHGASLAHCRDEFPGLLSLPWILRHLAEPLQYLHRIVYRSIPFVEGSQSFHGREKIGLNFRCAPIMR